MAPKVARFEKVEIHYHSEPQLIISDNKGYWKIWCGYNFNVFQQETERLTINGSTGDLGFAGRIAAYSFDQTCSAERKENIDDIAVETAQAVISNLRPVSYDLKDDTTGAGNFGFVFEELPKELQSKPGKTVSPMDVIAFLVKTVQSQQSTIDELGSRVEALSGARPAST